MASDPIEVTIGGLDYTIDRVRLGSFLKLQRAARRLRKAADKADTGAIADALFEYLMACIPNLSREDFNNLPWYEVISAYQKILFLNAIPGAENFSMLKNVIPNKGGTIIAWDHDDREVMLWIHTIAMAYKWSRPDIENLWPEEAVGFIQEILADNQFEKEFIYSLSEIAYPYDKATKKSRFIPMTRPAWMVIGGGKKNERVLKEALPVGNVLYPKDDERFKDVLH